MTHLSITLSALSRSVSVVSVSSSLSVGRLEFSVSVGMLLMSVSVSITKSASFSVISSTCLASAVCSKP